MVTITGLSNPWRATGRTGATIEVINRTGAGTDVLNRALAKIPPIDNSGDADFHFGKAARFTLTTPDQKTNPGMTVTFPPDDPQDDPSNPIVIHDYDYVDRAVEKLKIEQPGEPDNWVEAARDTKVMFVSRDNGEYYRFNIDWSKAPSETTEAKS